MNIVKVDGENKGEIFIYTLSTCGWCKKTKSFLNQLGVAYRYVDVDLVPESEEEEVVEELKKWNKDTSFPTMIIGEKLVIVGFQPEKVKDALGL